MRNQITSLLCPVNLLVVPHLFHYKSPSPYDGPRGAPGSASSPQQPLRPQPLALQPCDAHHFKHVAFLTVPWMSLYTCSAWHPLPSSNHTTHSCMGFSLCANVILSMRFLLSVLLIRTHPYLALLALLYSKAHLIFFCSLSLSTRMLVSRDRWFLFAHCCVSSTYISAWHKVSTHIFV